MVLPLEGITVVALEHLSGARVLEIERETLLAAVGPDEMRAQAVSSLVIAACEIATIRALDLDDARALIRQLPGTERRRDRVLQRDDGDACQRQFHVQKLRGKPSTCSAT